MSGGFFTSAFPDDYQPPDIDTSVAHQARVCLELLEPGVVPVNYWRPGPGGPDPAGELPAYVAVGRKR